MQGNPESSLPESVQLQGKNKGHYFILSYSVVSFWNKLDFIRTCTSCSFVYHVNILMIFGNLIFRAKCFEGSMEKIRAVIPLLAWVLLSEKNVI